MGFLHFSADLMTSSATSVGATEQIANRSLVFNAVDPDVDDDGAGFDELVRDQSETANGGDDDIAAGGDLGQVRGA